MWKLRIGNAAQVCIFTSVFHRILDFKTGQDFYPALFLFKPTLKPLNFQSRLLPYKKGHLKQDGLFTISINENVSELLQSFCLIC